MRRKFLSWIMFSILKKPQGEIIPAWLCWLLFPINSFYYHRFDYDPLSDSVYIYGKQISRMFIATISGHDKSMLEEYLTISEDKEQGIIFTKHLHDRRNDYIATVIEELNKYIFTFSSRSSANGIVIEIAYIKNNQAKIAWAENSILFLALRDAINNFIAQYPDHLFVIWYQKWYKENYGEENFK